MRGRRWRVKLRDHLEVQGPGQGDAREQVVHLKGVRRERHRLLGAAPRRFGVTDLKVDHCRVGAQLGSVQGRGAEAISRRASAS